LIAQHDVVQTAKLFANSPLKEVNDAHSHHKKVVLSEEQNNSKKHVGLACPSLHVIEQLVVFKKRK